MLYITVVLPNIYIYKEDYRENKHVFYKSMYKAYRYSYSSVQPEDHVHLSSCSCYLQVNKNYMNYFP